MHIKNHVFTVICLGAILFSSGCNNPDSSDEKISVTSITLNENQISLFEGENFTLTASVSPFNATDKTVTWKSRDEEIATVNNGYVVAIKEGSTIIEARSVSDKSVYKTCSLDVYKRQTEDDSLVSFKTKSVDICHYSPTPNKKTTIYYREDKLQKYPYISLKNYYNLLLGKDLTIEKLETNKYKLTSANDGIALIDTRANTLESDDFNEFVSTTIYRQDHVTNVYFDGAPFIRVNNVQKEQKPRKTSINWENYGVNIFGTDDDIIVPLVTASNLFQGPTMLTCFYNADNIYFIDPNDPDFNTGNVFYSMEYNNGILKFFEYGQRTAEEAKFSYGELCFFIDAFYGLPGREYIHSAYAKEKNLDKVLIEFNDLTRVARQLLLSTDEYEYLAGLLMLQDFLSDAGHSYTGYSAYLLYLNYLDIRNKVDNVLNQIPYKINQTAAARNATSAYTNGLGDAHSNSGLSNLGNLIQGDTVFFRFDGFNFNLNEWNQYYTNPVLSNLPSDPVGNFKRLLEQHKDNTSIKNVVIDITTNGGGFGDVVVALMGLMTGKSYIHSHDMIGDYYYTVTYDFDANFDGVFDENDKAVSYPFNFAILTSAYSFSCGNLLPAVAKENGIMTIGDKSGGGCCAVLDAINAQGMYVRLSSPDHFVTLKNEEVEFGVEADKVLVQKVGEDAYDFTNMYNFELIAQEVSNFYK